MATFEVSHCWSCGKRFGSKRDGLCSHCRNRRGPTSAASEIVAAFVMAAVLMGAVIIGYLITKTP